MNHKHFKNKYTVDKTLQLHNIINSINIENVNYREIFDNAVQFAYGRPLEEYYEKNIEAIMVNDIRHNYSNYDDNLKRVYRIKRTDSDYEQYKNSVLEKISNTYPLLKDECNKQKRKCNMVKII
jgi:hypothetical protein